MYPKKGAQVIIDILMENVNKDNILLNTMVRKIDLRKT